MKGIVRSSLLLACLVTLSLVQAPAPAGSETIRTDTWIEPKTGMQFVWVPSGCFDMGSPSSEEGRYSNEEPVHRVCVTGFWMGEGEVTRRQFQAFVEATGYRTDAENEGFSWIYDGNWEMRVGYDWRKAGFEQGELHPVVNVSWNDARAMANWLSRQHDGVFRLPTEAEWEYACRSGTQTARYWGDSPDEACRHGNVADASARDQFPAWKTHGCEDGYVFTAPVGRFRPNALGLHDMLGNVWEWVEDAYSSSAYDKHRNENPVYAKGSSRVIRGGSWHSRPEYARCASRDHLRSPARRSQDLGFRLVKTR